jgi:RNase P subunit RPR2
MIETLPKSIQGIRLYCPKCKTISTPITFVTNESKDDSSEMVTTGLKFKCMKCGTIVGTASVNVK